MTRLSNDVVEWVRTASEAEFVDRITAEPGLLQRRDIGEDGFSLLHQVAALGRSVLIQSILERGLSIDTPSGDPEEFPDSLDGPPRFDPGYTPLMAAAAHGQVAVVRQLLAMGADPLKTDYYRGNALHSAASNGSVQIVNVLLAAGCNPDAECDYKANCEELGFYWVGTPLHVASIRNKGRVARALIGHGAAVDALGMLDERRPVHYAAAMGAASCLEVLLRAGADPNRPEVFHGFTPLHYAASEAHVECVELLLRFGADPSRQLTETRHTPIDLARDFYIAERAEAACRLLRDAGSD